MDYFQGTTQVKVALQPVDMPASARSHLISAVYEWAVEQGFTPYIMVYTKYPNRYFPAAKLARHIENDQLTFNVHPTAIKNFLVKPNEITFSAKFGGERVDISVEMDAVLAVIAKENRWGFVFPTAKNEPAVVIKEPVPPMEVVEKQDDIVQPIRPPRGKPTLRIVK